MQRSNYIVQHAFHNFLMASILTCVVQQLRVLIDGVVVSHLVGPVALSAINLYLPLEESVYAIIMLFTVGAGFIAAYRQSQHDHVGVSNQFTVALTSGLTVVVGLVICLFLLFPQLIDLLADEGATELYDYTASYTKVLLLSFMIQVPNSVLRTFISIDGQPQLVTRSIVVSFVLNIVLDLIFVGTMNMGMEGAAWATLISDMTGLFMLLPYATGRNCSFALIDVSDYVGELRESMSEGFPLSIGNLVAGIVVMLTNQVILGFEGPNGVFLFAIVFQLLAMCGMVTEGLGEINESIGGVLLGEGDNTSFRMLVHKCYKFLWAVMLVTCLVILVFPQYIMTFFGADAEQLTPDNIAAIRVASLIFLPYIMTSFNASVHALVGYETLSTVILLMQASLMVGMPYIVAAIDRDLFWWSFPVGGLLAVSIQMSVSYLIHRRKRDTTELALLPTVPDCVSMDHSILYDETAIESSLRDAGIFFDVCELDAELRDCLLECCKVIAYNILRYSTDKKKNSCYDLRIQDKEDELEIWFKDAGKPYNPAQELVVPESMEKQHKYIFGLNVTTLRVTKKNYERIYE